jgi:phenylacetate-CoA ligase
VLRVLTARHTAIDHDTLLRFELPAVARNKLTVDFEGGNQSSGEKGELVFTTLTKEGMPVIRYRTRDLTRLLPGTARNMRRLEKITGRSDDMMIVRGVNVFPTQIEEILLKIEPLSAHYQVVLTREGRMDEMEVLVEIRPEADTAANRSQSTALLVGRIKDSIGVTAKVRVVDANAIGRSLGKAKRIVDKRPKG